MKYARLVLSNLLRNKRRTVLTVFSVTVAFFLYGTLRSVITTLDSAAEMGSEARLVVSNASGVTFLLPEAHRQRLETVDGIASVSWANWFGGYYQDPQDFFAQFAIKADTYLPMYPEIEITQGDIDAFYRERTAAIVGVGLLEKYGWQIDQNVTLQSPFTDHDWEFTIRAAYTPTNPSYGDQTMFFHYEYFYEGTDGQLTPGWFILQLEDPDRAAEIAATIDAMFENSTAPTKTETERAWQAGFITMWGNIGFLVRALGTAVFFAILFVAANTMMMAARERVGEYAVMKTLGFPNVTVFGIVLAESLFITLLGGGLGLLLARWIFSQPTPLNTFFPGFGVRVDTLLLGIGLAALLGLVSGAIPAWQSSRLSVVNALRRVV